MHYELTALELLIQRLHPNVLVETMSETQTAESINQIEKETARIRASMIDEVLKTRDSQANEIYVETQQKGLIALANWIYEYEKQTSDMTMILLYKEIAQTIENILSFILRFFDKYYDEMAQISKSYADIARKELTKKYIFIQKGYKKLPVNKDLLMIALNPLKDFIYKAQMITYQRLNYLRDLSTRMLLIIEDSNAAIDNLIYNYQLAERELLRVEIPEAKINIKMHISLLYLNHNSHEYISFCVDSLQRKKTARINPDYTNLFLHSYAKMLKQLKVKPNSKLDIERKGARQQILNWIEVELEYQHEAPELTAFIGKEDMEIPIMRINKKVDKLNMKKWSVPLLAYNWRIYKQLDAVEENKPDIVRFIAQHFNSVGTDAVSETSVSNNWFNPSTTTKLAALQFFQDCISEVRKDLK